MRAAYDTIEELNAQLGGLVAERQSLRESGADADALERNRLRICSVQRHLTYALIARYLPGSRAA
jgi:hypothetical protein